ncbi:sugar ABC transporter substrate-binding protein [Bifidobacterium moukalabense DSM 27321]|jgi:ABC-type sugar transport system substrate-binding protein|uniref:Sugar ABC transporter substrate-binding protein n=3 Tax=Bifidobacterium moukalabense TaxID=1333651 RepID=W4NAL6_9BIFI|nr:sugar ABC transporter substrate-binding protein [Bifidobacterium moukalabense DSM 27321]
MLTIMLAASLAACTPPNGAVGDTQSQDSAVAHIGPDRADTEVAFIGSQDIDADGLALDALEQGRFKPIYIPVTGTVDAQQTAMQGVRDMTQRKVDIIIVGGMDVTDSNRGDWQAALRSAREAGIAVALLDPVHAPEDGKLYAATLTVDGRKDDAIPLADAVMTISNNDPHERDMSVTTR